VPFLKYLPESCELGQRVARGGLQIDGLEVDALQIGKPRFDLLPADPDLPKALIHEVPIGRRGDVEEPIGLDLEGGELRLELGNLIARVRRLGEGLFLDELPEDSFAAPSEVLLQPLLNSPQDEVLEGIAAQTVSLADRFALGPVAAADVVVGRTVGAVRPLVFIPVSESL